MVMNASKWRSFPTEAQRLGTLLALYGELEFEAANVVGVILRDHDTAFRLMFRLKTEGQRLEVFNALTYPTMKRYGLEGEYAHVFGALRYCKSIRNRYAHSHWHTRDGAALEYCNMESGAEKSDGQPSVKLVCFSLSAIDNEIDYFGYCSLGIEFLEQEIRVRNGDIPDHSVPKPIARPKPGP